MPAGAVSSPVVGLGSGKFGTPWARMQRDTARSFCISWGLTCGGDVVGGPEYFAQARCAAWNCGEDASEATLSWTWVFQALIALDVAREPGSGKLTTPCERMQLANSTGPLDDWLPAAAAVAGTAVGVVPILATPALGAPPPQAAVASARPMTAGRTNRSRQRLGRPVTGRPVASRRRLIGSRGSSVSGWSTGGSYEKAGDIGITPSGWGARR